MMDWGIISSHKRLWKCSIYFITYSFFFGSQLENREISVIGKKIYVLVLYLLLLNIKDSDVMNLIEDKNDDFIILYVIL